MPADMRITIPLLLVMTLLVAASFVLTSDGGSDVATSAEIRRSLLATPQACRSEVREFMQHHVLSNGPLRKSNLRSLRLAGCGTPGEQIRSVRSR